MLVRLGVGFIGLLSARGATALTDISPQPYFASVDRVLAALAETGSPVAPGDALRLAELIKMGDANAITETEKILSQYTLAKVEIDRSGYASATPGGARRILVEEGWRGFLLRVENPVGAVSALRAQFGRGPVVVQSTGASRAGVVDTLNEAPRIANAWVTGKLYESPSQAPGLSGLPIEYRVVLLYSRDHGTRTVGFRISGGDGANVRWRMKREVTLDFECLASRDVALSIKDADGRGCMASLTIKDEFNRVYPLQPMRLAPDMYFHAHIYRADGETVRLPDGRYTVESWRGPEYLRAMQTVTVGAPPAKIGVELKRWIDPARWGWYSGDTHIHASGCSHYEHPTEGVSPETIIRFVRGEALSVGEVLSWGGGWYYQKQFFTGRAISPEATLEHPDLQAANNAAWQSRPTSKDAGSVLRYDVEVSGFPSSHCGHLVLLRLKDQDYPGTKIIQDWPSWNLPILRWAREQGALGGVAHCGFGMQVESKDLPNYEIPPMDSIGTQEAIVDATHGYVDFLSGCDSEPTAELNGWYHLLNCGFRMAMIGETDYPCFTDARPGVGRSYVRLDQPPIGDAGYEAWVRGLREGKLYCGDGRSHFLNFQVEGHRSGEKDLALGCPTVVSIEALVAARLDPEPLPPGARNPDVPADFVGWRGWHIEKARIGGSREVPVELIVNGQAVDRVSLLADGTPQTIRFKAQITQSSWIALRIFPSAHTYPVFITVGGKPIRASKRSAQWCRECVDKLWEVKKPFMRETERPAAAEAFDHARRAYEKIIQECEVD